MTAVATPQPTLETVADVLTRLPGVPPERILLRPVPGTATEADLVAYLDGDEKRLCELVDGVLVEKPMGYYESSLAGILIHLLHRFLEEQNLGIVLTPDGPVRVSPRRVRLPDVSFVGWDHFPNRKLPRGAILRVAPDLAVEILSESNTRAEMEEKLADYFAAGVRLVWYLDPDAQTVQVFTSPTDVTTRGLDDTLDGGDVLPGFRLSIREWFERAGEREAE